MRKLVIMSEVLKALSDPTRLKIILLLTSSKKLCVNAIANKVGMTQPAISQQLKILKNAGIIEPQKVGLYVHYSINDEKIEEYIKDFINIFHGEQKQLCTKCPEK